MTAEAIRPLGPRKWAGLAGWILAPLAAGFIGSQVTDPAWYRTLDRPEWAPPSWLFGPVWTALYVSMGVAAWLVWKRAGFTAARGALALFIAQLVLNAAWSWLFFGLQRADLAFYEIMLLWIFIAATMIAFHRHSRAAAWLLAPYLAWVSYAGALTFALWRRGA